MSVETKNVGKSKLVIDIDDVRKRYVSWWMETQKKDCGYGLRTTHYLRICPTTGEYSSDYITNYITDYPGFLEDEFPSEPPYPFEMMSIVEGDDQIEMPEVCWEDVEEIAMSFDIEGFLQEGVAGANPVDFKPDSMLARLDSMFACQHFDYFELPELRDWAAEHGITLIGE